MTGISMFRVNRSLILADLKIALILTNIYYSYQRPQRNYCQKKNIIL